MWDGDMSKKVIDVESGSTVYAVDVSPNSTRFATGTRNEASVWSISSGERLVGPLKHDNWVAGVRFSPTGEHFATFCHSHAICVFDSQTGDKLLTIKAPILQKVPVTPLVWSSDAQQIFVASNNKVGSFSIATGSLLAESQIHHYRKNDIHSIALAANNKFIATTGDHSISFFDTSTLTQIGPVIEDSDRRLASIAISADSSHLATGRSDGKIIIRDLSKILPDSYGPFHVSTCAFIISACQVISIPPPMVIKLHRHLLTMKCDKRSSLSNRETTMAKHQTPLQ